MSTMTCIPCSRRAGCSFAGMKNASDVESIQSIRQVPSPESEPFIDTHDIAGRPVDEMLSETIAFVLRVQAHLEENKDTGVKKDDPTAGPRLGMPSVALRGGGTPDPASTVQSSFRAFLLCATQSEASEDARGVGEAKRQPILGSSHSL